MLSESEFIDRLEDLGIDHFQQTTLLNLFRTIPQHFSRSEVGRSILRGVISSGTCANADSNGCGPAGSFVLNGKKIYERGEFLLWLANRRPMRRGSPVHRSAQQTA